MHAGAVGEIGNVALDLHRQREGGREQFLARASGQRAERIVGIGDGAAAVAAHDDVALRLEEAFGALLRFADLPIAVGSFFEMGFKAPQLRLHLADAGNQEAHGPACGAEQGGDADGKSIRIVVVSLRQGARQEAERDAERHRRNHDGADDEGEQPAGDDGGFQEGDAREHGPYPRSACWSRLMAPPRSGLVYRCDAGNLAYECCASLAVGNAGSGRLEGGLMLC